MTITVAIALIRALHAGYVIFVVCAPVLVLSGVLLSLRPLHGRWVCGLHIAAMIFVTIQHALGWSCPLTELENTLRGLPPGTTFLGDLPPLPSSVFITVVGGYLALSVLAHTLAGRSRSRQKSAIPVSQGPKVNDAVSELPCGSVTVTELG